MDAVCAGAGACVAWQAGAVAAQSDLGAAATRRRVTPEDLGAAMLVRRALVRAALIGVVVVRVVVAQAVYVVEWEERPHRRVRRVRGAAAFLARVLGLARRHLGFPPEILPDFIDVRVQEPIDRIAGCAFDVRSVPADERVNEAVIRLELGVPLDGYIGEGQLVHHVGDVSVGEEILARRSLRARVGRLCRLQGAQVRGVSAVVYVPVASTLEGISPQTRPQGLAFGEDAPTGEVTNGHVTVVVTEIVCSGKYKMYLN